MPVQIDHVVIAGSNLAQLRAQAETRGLVSVEGGVHAGGQTHNALVGFPDGSYLELIAPLPGNTAPDHAWSAFMLNNAGVSAWAIRCAAIEADAALYRSRGITVSDPVSGGRTRTDGVRLEWRTAKLGDEVLGSVLPFLIQDLTLRELRVPKPTGIHQKIAGIEAVVFDVTDDNDPYLALLRQAFDSALINDQNGLRLDNAPVHFNVLSWARGLHDMRLSTR
jgi:hypothetical protein